MSNMIAKEQYKDICLTIQDFLSRWDRHEWMIDHGEWASENWTQEREDYADAANDILDLMDDIKDPERSCTSEASNLQSLAARLAECAQALDGQVTPDESDYIAEGTIDPDGVADIAESLEIGTQAQGWDCVEGWAAYRHGDALYVNWWRDAFGNRHARDLWVCVDETYFNEE